ncbi:MAG TPA: hypothetical protein VJT12_03405 [Methyloceanibacter sp.]|nr:hypothetical protein [Methyloceanibacter sp.]
MSDARADAPAPGDASTSGDSTLSREASLDAATSCEIEESSTLPHVRFAFRIQDCTFTLAQAAAGISIPYDLIVEADVPGFVTSPYPSGPTTANLDISENLAGGSQGYCVCDRGKRPTQCPLSDGGTVLAMTSCDPVTLPAGTYHRAFQWDGHNWSGPSDTNNPKGALFPAGDYVLAVETREGTIGDGGAMKATGKITIHLVP